MSGLLILDILILLGIFAFGLFSAVHERVWGSIFTLIALGAAAYYQFNVYPTGDNWLAYVAGAVGYFLIGGLYAMFVTWPRFLRRHSKDIADLYERFHKSTNDGSPYAIGYKDFTEKHDYRSKYGVENNKERIVSYICSWIWDAVWVVLKNPIVWTYNTIYDMFGRGYAAIGRKVTAQIIVEHEKNRKDAPTQR